MKKAIGTLSLLALMFCFGAALPPAHAKKSCTISFQLMNKTGKQVTLKKLEAKRAKKKWKTAYSGSVTLPNNPTMIFNLPSSSKTIRKGSCSKNHKVRVSFQCPNKTTVTKNKSPKLQGSGSTMTVTVTLTATDCN